MSKKFYAHILIVMQKNIGVMVFIFRNIGNAIDKINRLHEVLKRIFFLDFYI